MSLNFVGELQGRELVPKAVMSKFIRAGDFSQKLLVLLAQILYFCPRF